MESWVVRLAHDAIWAMGIIFLFAVIGVIATIRWIFGLIFKTERAVEGGIQSAEHYVTRR